MMFFHRHKRDLGEIREEPKVLCFCGSDGKQEGKRVSDQRQDGMKKRQREETVEGRESERERDRLYSCISSVYDIILSRETSQEECTAWMSRRKLLCSRLSKCHHIYLPDIA